MSYITDIFAFQDWIEYDSSITPNEIALWYALVRIFNKLGNPEELSIPISTLIPKCKLSRNSIYKSRNRLKQLGLIDFKDRKGNQSSVYKTIKFRRPTVEKNDTIRNLSYELDENGQEEDLCTKIETQRDTQVDTQSDTQSDTQMDTQVDTQVDTQRTPKPALESGLEDPLKIKNKNKNKNKNIYLTTFDIYNNTQENLTCECVSATTNDDIVSLFNKICSNLPKVTKLSKKRTQLLAKLFKSGYTQQEFKQVFEMANNSDFLCGKTANSTFRANFDWVLNENNFIKILEGNYANLGNKNLSDGINQERKPSYDIDEHRRDCQNALMRSRSSGTFLETLKEEYEKPEHIEVEVT